MNKIKIGILKETKSPPDKRVVFSPDLARTFQQNYPAMDLVVQNSKIRSFKDDEYVEANIPLQEDMGDCDILLGIKEVVINTLIPNKTYFFFSHTAKKQNYNRGLLKACLEKNITLIDHEYLTYPIGNRLVAFGFWAGVVGAYNGIIALGRRTGLFRLKRAHECFDLNDMLEQLKNIKLPTIKIILTGEGRVASGAMKILQALEPLFVKPDVFLNDTFDRAVVCQIGPKDYVQHKENGSNFELSHFFQFPQEYESAFKPFTKQADLFIACHYWDPRSPVFMTKADIKETDFKIRVIADVSCDIGGPIPSTLRPSTINEPFYGYHPFYEAEDEPWKPMNITVMAIDNLPAELPRDASIDFGKSFLNHIVPAIDNKDKDGILERATITRNGKLTNQYAYLQDFADGKE